LEFDTTSVFGYLLIVSRNLCLNHKRTQVELVNIDDFLIGFNDSRYEEIELFKADFDGSRIFRCPVS
jgi:hypothetical protein